MSGQRFYVTVRDLPGGAGRCDAMVDKRKWEYGRGFSPIQERCSRSAANKWGSHQYCAQHHPDQKAAWAAIEREQKIAEAAYEAAKKAGK